MILRASIAMLCLSLSVGAGFTCAAEKDGLKELAGTWQVTSMMRDGKKTPAEQVEKMKTIITAEGDVSVQREGKDSFHLTLKVDSSKSPKETSATYKDGENKGKSVLGIYEIDGDTLKYCFGAPGKDRPKEFSSKEGSGNALITYKRAK